MNGPAIAWQFRMYCCTRR